jgi:hypothetical protein
MNRSTKSLILNVIFPSLFLGGLAGTGLGYWLAKPGQAPTEAPVLAQKTQDLQEEQKLRIQKKLNRRLKRPLINKRLLRKLPLMETTLLLHPKCCRKWPTKPGFPEPCNLKK